MSVPNDLALYERHASEWWDERSRTFRSLRSVNAYRMELVKEWLGERLDGARVADLGCGGGLLSHPVAALGARVVGVDVSGASLRAALARDGSAGRDFVRGDFLRVPLRDSAVDVVLLADVLEHTERPDRALAEAARVLRPGGACFVNTINRTRRARWLVSGLAEAVGLVPRGTHDARLFVTPDELHSAAERAGLSIVRLQGEAPVWLETLRRWAIVLRRSDEVAIGYSALFLRR